MTAPVPPEVRKLRQELHKKRLRDTRRAALRDGPIYDPRKLDRGKYSPHQGEREMARRALPIADASR